MTVTIDNAHTFIGAKVEFNFGAYFPVCEGIIVDFNVIPASKWFPVSVQLVAEYVDPETDETVKTTVTQFSDKGIGCRIVEMPSEITLIKNRLSPWSK